MTSPILSTDQAPAAPRKRGRLKVFLGMSPGVGKTYEMLRAARRRKAEGEDVVVGVVETHGRKETMSLLRGLEVMARRPIAYRERTLLEFDIDAAIARRPDLLLVDEYAHSNAPGSRHPKRWQDVEEILEAGIDVWTTLNVQHLESLSDVVLRITGVRQRESVPDSALSRADDIELVDITPEELRKRLAEGKVYVPETARLASDNFFKVENLTALRELALRRAAQTVDDQLTARLREQGAAGPWAAGERILVLVAGDAMAGPLVRTGRRMSDMMMDAPWTVAHVDRPSGARHGVGSAGKLSDALKLAEQLGGRTVVLSGDDVVRAIMDHAHNNHVTQIVLAKGRDSRLSEWLGRSLAAELLRQARGVAVHVVTDEVEPEPKAPKDVRLNLAGGWRGYAVGVACVIAATGLALLLDRTFERVDLGVIYLTAVLAAGALYGLRPALAAATVAFLTYNFLFLQPKFSFAIGSPTDVLTLIVFWGVALTTGALAGRVREQARAAQRRASAVSALLAASQRLTGIGDRGEAARILAEQTAAAAGAGAVVLLPVENELTLTAGAPGKPELDAEAMAAARWAWEKGEPAGHGTGTLPQARWSFRPLQGVRDRAGVAGIEAAALSPGSDEEKLALALLDQGAVAVERADLAGQAVETETLRRTDRFRGALMNSVSHDLRTPLSTVLGASTTLIDLGDKLKPAVRADLLLSIREEAERLSRYVGDLLDMTRLEGGGLNIRADWVDVRDVLNAAGKRVARRLGERKLARDFPAQLSLVMVDQGLLEQALVNILENAIAYSPDGSTVELAAYEDRGAVVISIEDEGKGIPTAELERVFDKFRRMEEPSDRTKGAGLGLAIARGFVEAMNGRIAAASPIQDGKGTRILISLPKAVVTHPSLL
ncbi:sensor histidine kinase KdpD [Brevundimonas diminuta]|jgi:two-component system, OmpR family, sensor histidine kinase KdpD|uniref:histidine kinase n=2 Tax=Brevundimonas TaxID=41275 RepID=A0A410NZ16_BREDI|nr:MULTISPECIES: sensor histidine kinase KdpD [Brevundimonas]MBD3572619.1 sensor histidine kinase KdpD [Brevundimonas diminuta]MBI2250444.1 sensor histidine kinase KdpD [Brevundimonas diminuta]QAT15142.1 sensor histidine kinase KdpD [Brevundimonas diminuta]QQB87474.1 sensor histidine kinase KdpD [Brevundimonas diminuta]VTO14719.1 Sensor protein KdpD [Brevundimonas vancanneytii]